MFTKKQIILKSILAIVLVVILIMTFVTGGDIFIVLIGGGFLWFMAYALWIPPEKHKNFSYSDQQQAIGRAMGGSGPPDLLQVFPRKDKHKPRKKKRGHPL